MMHIFPSYACHGAHAHLCAIRVGPGMRPVKWGRGLMFCANKKQKSSSVAGLNYSAQWEKQLCLLKINLNSN